MRMAPSTRTSEHAEFHYGVLLAAVPWMRRPYGPRLPGGSGSGSGWLPGCVPPTRVLGVCRVVARNPGGRDRAGRTTVRRLAHNEDVIVQAKGATWDVAVAWSRLVWATDPQPPPAPERKAPMEEYVLEVAD